MLSIEHRSGASSMSSVELSYRLLIHCDTTPNEIVCLILVLIVLLADSVTPLDA